MKKNKGKSFFLKKLKPQEASLLSLASSVGFSFVFAIILGLLSGIWLDKKVNTAPLFTIVGLLMGVIAGFKNLFIISKKVELKEKELREQIEKEEDDNNQT